MEKEIFQVNYKDELLRVERLDLGGQTFFRITFPGNPPPLTILRVKHFNWVKPLAGRNLAAAILSDTGKSLRFRLLLKTKILGYQ